MQLWSMANILAPAQHQQGECAQRSGFTSGFVLPAVFAGLDRQAMGRVRLQGLHARAWAHSRVLLAHSSATPVLSIRVGGANGGRTAEAGEGSGCCAMSAAVRAVDWVSLCQGK